jgi:imidazolonepropionase-like amidohydrolase
VLTWLATAALATADPGCATAFTHVAVGELGDRTVLVSEGRIAAIGASGAVAIPACAAVLDASGLALSPGLHDMHVHLEDPSDLRRFLAAGVTTVVNMSGSPRHLAWAAEIEEGRRAGPHLITTGPMLDTVDDPLFGLTVDATDPATAAAIVRSQHASGYAFVKVHGALPLDAWQAAVETARALGMPVVGHVPEAVGLRRVLASRPATIEHAEEVMLGAFADGLRADQVTGVARDVAQAGVVVTPTLVAVMAIGDQLAGRAPVIPDDLSPLTRAVWADGNNPYLRFYSPAEVATFPARLALQGALTKALHRAGVPLLVGTDAGWVPWVIPGRSVHEELALLDGLGIPRVDVLAGTTRAAAALLGTGAGVVAVGAPADLVLTDGDPTLDLSAYDRLIGTMVGGRWYPAQALAAPPPLHSPAVEALAAGDGAAAAAAALGEARAGTLRPDDAHVLALALARLGWADEAVSLLAATAALHPRSWDAHLGLARVSALSGDSEAARAHRRGALRSAPRAARAAVRQIFAAPI